VAFGSSLVLIALGAILRGRGAGPSTRSRERRGDVVEERRVVDRDPVTSPGETAARILALGWPVCMARPAAESMGVTRPSRVRIPGPQRRDRGAGTRALTATGDCRGPFPLAP